MDLVYYRIKEVAQKTGLTKRALRYYEDMKLVTPIRTDAGYRLYSEEDILWTCLCAFILMLLAL